MNYVLLPEKLSRLILPNKTITLITFMVENLDSTFLSSYKNGN